MSDLDRIVDVTVSTESTGISQDSFGSMLILGHHTRFNDLYRIYGGLGEMSADGFTPYDDEYRAVAAACAQSPRPKQFVVGRMTSAPSYSMRIQILSATQNDVISGKLLLPQTGQEFSFSRTVPGSSSLGAEATAVAALINDSTVNSIIASGFATTTGTQTLSGASLNGTIGGSVMSPGKRLQFVFSNHANWLSTTIVVTGTDYNGNVITDNIAVPAGGNATVISAKVFRSVTSIAVPVQGGTSGTATVGTIADVVATVVNTSYIDVTPLTAGSLVHLHSLTKLGIECNTASASYDTALTNLQAVYDDWYFVAIDDMSSTNVAAVAAWVEANSSKKLFFWQTPSTLEQAGGASAPSNALKIYKRTVGGYFPKSADFGHFSWVSYGAASFPGSITWKFKNLPGVTGTRLTAGVMTALEGNNMNYYALVHGRNCMQQGVTQFGEFVDVVHGIDALISALQEAAYQVMSALPKVPLNKRGLLLLKTALDTAAKPFIDTESNPGLITKGTWNLVMPDIGSIPAVDKRNRRVSGVLFSGNLAGAVHFLSIRGNLTAA